MWTEGLIVCALALAEVVAGWGGNVPADYESRLKVCAAVVERAPDWGIPQSIAVSVGMQESGFAPTRSRAGAVGPLQVMTRHHCPGRTAAGCDLVDAGFHALKKYALEFGCGQGMQDKVREVRKWSRPKYIALTKTHELCQEPDWKEALCNYNQGGEARCGRKARVYAHEVLRRVRRLERQMRAVILVSGEGG